MAVLLAVLVILSVFLAGYVLGLVRARDPNLGLVREALAAMNTYSLDPLPDELRLERSMIHAAIGALNDPFSVYVEPAQHELQADDLAGEFGGIGALLTIDEDGRVLITPLAKGPAQVAGIQPGSVLVSVDRVQVPLFPSLPDLIASLRGPEGTKVHLVIRGSDEVGGTLEYTLTRERFDIPSVSAFLSPLDPALGVIKLVRFAETSPAELEAGYDSLRDQGIQALVLDLRDNGGGLLDSTVSIASFFLPSGIVLKEERVDHQQKEYRVEKPGRATDLPLAIFINENTASAAEVLAAALRENRRALLIGSQTFGKGTVQAVVELSDGSSLHITTARWLTPEGKTLDGTGLVPDYPLESGSESGPDPYLTLAQHLLLHESVGP
ncbi:MAG: S41 family peptidase [Anaerolineales bacterium]